MISDWPDLSLAFRLVNGNFIQNIIWLQQPKIHGLPQWDKSKSKRGKTRKQTNKKQIKCRWWCGRYWGVICQKIGKNFEISHLEKKFSSLSGWIVLWYFWSQVLFKNFHKCSTDETFLIPTDMAYPGARLSPLSRGKGISPWSEMSILTPASCVRDPMYWSCSMFSSRLSP